MNAALWDFCQMDPLRLASLTPVRLARIGSEAQSRFA
jgi:hypothetical protein